MPSVDENNKGRFAPFILPAVALVVLLPIAVIIGVLLVDGNDSEDPDPNPTVGASPVPDGDVALVKTVDFAFEPNDIAATSGQTVVFQNISPSAHSVKIEGTDEEIHLESGNVGEWTPDEAGDFPIVCTVHPNLMTGTITVSD